MLVLGLAACSNSSGINAVDFDNNKESSNEQFNFDGNYTPPELSINGEKDDEEWSNCSDELTFGSLNQTKMVMYRGENALFCFFEVEDPDIQTVGNNNGDDVTHGDSVEVYFDFGNDAANKPLNDDIQINIGAHGKTRIFVGSNGQWGSWNGLLDYEIKLDGTLNDSSDTDNGYKIELMIPYSQVGIDKNSVFGVAVGHVARGKDSTHETLQYTWGGMVYEGAFVDPQIPRGYVVLMGNRIYSRSNMPIGLIDITGKVVDENNASVVGATVKINDNVVTTDDAGKYEIKQIDADTINNIIVSKDGYLEYTKEVSKTELKNESSRVNINLCLISNSSNKMVTISGVVKNPVEGLIKDAHVSLGDSSVTSNEAGEFSITAKLCYDMNVIVSKVGYKDSSNNISPLALINESNYNIGTLSVYSPSSTTTFGGARGIPAVDAEIYRGFDGIHFLFKTSSNIVNGDHIEVFVDSGSSFNGRDTSDYRIDFTGDGTISIVNFGNGTNTIVSSSGITNNAYLDGTTYYIEAMIPYSFLSVTASDIIGVSFGVWSQSLSDWDGWQYPGAGFDAYVAPEYADQYCRIGLDNGLYRALSNDVKVSKVFGKVVDAYGNPVKSAVINGVVVNSDGGYAIYLPTGNDVTISVSADGYISKDVIISKDELNNVSTYKDITLSSAIAVITGTCNVEGAKVYLEGNPDIYTYVVDGSYSLSVPTTSNAYIVFECDGYKNVRFGVGVAALIQSASSNTPYTRNITMEAN